ncbi:E3 ubiquitin-protein ligase RNF181-like isoform X2 [Varroa destructor]|uniref:RING-type domain-containing protein n=1 Tax=Varroa destructor TaxID=109461 RepID=A0A7M7JKV8_VARDE|nr:E3 ubiquitin-protein ligase RNF181-like isoform X2 [Varroa destructor]
MQKRHGLFRLDATTQTECISSAIRCPICLLDLDELLSEKVNLVNVNVCKHFLCGPCLTAWLAKQKTCPLCRKALPEKEPFSQLRLT